MLEKFFGKENPRKIKKNCARKGCKRSLAEGMVFCDYGSGSQQFTYLKPNSKMHIECYIEHVMKTFWAELKKAG